MTATSFDQHVSPDHAQPFPLITGDAADRFTAAARTRIRGCTPACAVKARHVHGVKGNGQDIAMSPACAGRGHCPAIGPCGCDAITAGMVATGPIA